MKLTLALLLLLLGLAAAWRCVDGPRVPVGPVAPKPVAEEPDAELPAAPMPAGSRAPVDAVADLAVPAPADPPPAEHRLEPGLCVQELTLAGLLLDPRAGDPDFERAFAALPRAERVLARHRIRKLFAAGHEDVRAFRALVASAEEIDLLARELRWLSDKLAAEPADPFAVLGVVPVHAADRDPEAIARHYAGACDEDLAREHDALLRALAVENERALDERIALGLHRVRHQPAEF